ncbi:hypothetical protein [Aliarcobacter butzleri]|uniref:hypothetical protein n=1 Tax=Aliarcobacter butzleri TaxID=28197 RepID=UPI003B2283CD
MIELIKNILITVIVSLIVIVSYDKYSSKDNKNDEFIIFSGKNIIEYKKLQIKKALLNNEDTQNKEKELEELIKTMDLLLEDISKTYNKPIYQKEMIFKGKVRDITPYIEKALEKKGLL